MAIHQVCERDRERKEREGGIVMFVERVFFVFMCGCVVCGCVLVNTEDAIAFALEWQFARCG